MGQAQSASSPGSGGNGDGWRQRTSTMLRTYAQPAEDGDSSSLRPLPRTRRSSAMLLGRLHRSRSSSTMDNTPTSPAEGSQQRRPRFLRRAQSSISSSMPNLFNRRVRPRIRDDSSLLLSVPPSNSRPSPRHTISDPADYALPPSPSAIQHADGPISDIDAPLGSTASRRRSTARPSSMLADRFASLRPERLSRNMPNTLRRGRPTSTRGEDQIPVLSQLLSAAAAATAASLMGDDPNAVANARGIGGDEGTLESFLESLQNGRMASALGRSGIGNDDGSDPNGANGINFVRLFRFGSSTENSPNRRTESRGSSRFFGRQDRQERQENDSPSPADEPGPDGRMIPIIIVGIRSINPTAGRQDEHNIPSFIDALSNFPGPLTPSEPPNEGSSSQPQNGTRFSHRRRASMGGLGNPDIQRPHRHLDHPRPFSATSETEINPGPRPPPSTPASAGLSAFSSGTTTPNASVGAQAGSQSAAPSRRGSFARRPEFTPDEPMPMPRRTARRRRLSDSDFTRFGSGSSRRNGVVEPDDAEHVGSRSWIIYVLGGSYPENHPLLNTPSLFTDTPTYEDMLLLSSLLGPAKPPVASESDLASAPGLFTISNGDTPGTLIARAVDSEERIIITAEQRCLVCLCDFEETELARRLVQCSHLFHKDCIDQVSSINTLTSA